MAAALKCPGCGTAPPTPSREATHLDCAGCGRRLRLARNTTAKPSAPKRTAPSADGFDDEADDGFGGALNDLGDGFGVDADGGDEFGAFGRHGTGDAAPGLPP